MGRHEEDEVGEVPSEDMWRQFYRLGASSPHSWVLTAVRLGRAAGLVMEAVHEGQAARPGLMSASLDPASDEAERDEAEAQLMDALHDSSLFDIALMLAGFGIENLAKATLVRRSDNPVPDDSLVSHLKTHNLTNLVRRCGIKPTPEQDYVLRILSRQVTWSGRYPFPLNWSELQKRQTEMLEDAVSPMTASMIEHHVVELWSALQAGLNEPVTPKVGSSK